jgi:protein-S-isoprenylcysteine O-methyltransferase Ste14
VSGLVALRYFKGRDILPSWFKYSYLIVALLAVFAFSWAGKTGGEIMHSEITAEHTVIK